MLYVGIAAMVGLVLGSIITRIGGDGMLEVLKKRLVNLIEFVTSKKVIVGVGRQ